MIGFSIVWVGQVVSLVGTAMTQFALTIWAFEQTGRATDLALIGFFFMVPLLIVSPIAGVIVDRNDRKLMMMVSDLAAGVVTIITLVLFTTGTLQVWHLFITAAITGTFQTFQWPAYSAAISTMLPKEQYGRANGMIALAESGSGILAPVLAAGLLGLVGLAGVFAIDIISFTFAIIALLIVNIPNPQRTEAGKEGEGSVWKESAYGFRYILKRPSLLGLQLVFLAGNFISSISFSLLAPMILLRTGNNELLLGSVQSTIAIGGVVGGLLMSVWGGPKRLVHGVLLGWAFTGLAAAVFGAGQTAVIWITSGFMFTLVSPIINGSNQAIWQSKVAPDVQGRVFAIRRLIAWVSSPLGLLIAGPLADFVMEPAMQQGGGLTNAFGWLVGTGPGAGMSLMILISGVLITAVGCASYLFPAVRNAEDLLPDHEQSGESAEPTPNLETGEATAA
ncbi:MAG: MFS transporter [Chloroflexi bacterium]|nr:MAG: MFS transporter [Chloroflexota bacterium]